MLAAMGRALDDLIDLLELEQLEANLFRGVSPDEDRQRVFGGQVAGQALIAAGRTVDSDRLVHSLHAYFLRPGDPRIPIVYDVDRIRDGHSFTTRRVIAIQHGRAIFNLSASFQIVEPGPEHQYPMPDAPDPETAADDPRAARAVRRPLPARVRRLDPARPADRHALGRGCRAGSIPTPAHVSPSSWSGSVPTGSCPTTHSCTCVSSRTRPISRCSTPRSCRTRTRGTTTVS